MTKGRFSLFAAGSYRRSDGYIHNTDFENYNGYLRMNYDSEKAGFFDFQAGYQNRSFGSNGFYAAYNPDQFEHTSTVLSSLRWVKSVGRFTLNSSVSYRKNFDRYDWTRGTPMNHHNTDNAGAEFWADCTWKGGVTSLGGDYTYNHIYSTNLGEALSRPHGRYTHAKSRSTGNFWLHALWDFGPVESFGRLSSGAWAAARGRCGPVDATAYLHRSLLHIPCTAQ